MIFKVLKPEQLKECSSMDRNKEARAVYASGKLIYCYAMACWRCSLAPGQMTLMLRRQSKGQDLEVGIICIKGWLESALYANNCGMCQLRDVSFQGRIKHVFEDNLGRSQERKLTKPSVSCEQSLMCTKEGIIIRNLHFTQSPCA